MAKYYKRAKVKIMNDLKHIEKIFALFRLLTLNKYHVNGRRIIDELGCNKSTFHRIKAELSSLCGTEIIIDKKVDGYKFESYDEKINPVPGLCFKDDELEALICFEHLAESLQEGFISNVIKPFREKIETLVKLHGIESKNWKNKIHRNGGKNRVAGGMASKAKWTKRKR
jgi:hypothetical protein